MFWPLFDSSREPIPTPPGRVKELRSWLASEREIRRLFVEEGVVPAVEAVRSETGASILEANTVVDEIVQEMEDGSSPASSQEQ